MFRKTGTRPRLRLHVVPRFDNEIGFRDVMTGTCQVVIDPVEIRDRIRKRF